MQAFGGYIQRKLTDVQFQDFSGEEVVATSQPNRNLGTIQVGVNVSSMRRQALQNLGPKWGQTLNILYQQTTDNRTDRHIRLGGSLYFPGLSDNHSLKFSMGYQRELLKNNYQFSDGFDYPRGFGSILNDDFLKLGVDYQFPVSYTHLTLPTTPYV